jgi:putative iron-dependent peroxidase
MRHDRSLEGYAVPSTFSQPGILSPAPAVGRSLTFRFLTSGNPQSALRRLRADFKPEWGVVGLGEPVARRLGKSIAGLRTFPGLSGSNSSVPSTQQALWIFLRSDEQGALFDLTGQVAGLVEEGFALDNAIDTFKYAGGRDLSGYEDGTANPTGDAAIAAALVSSGDGLNASSFVAVQRWVHDLRCFRALSGDRRDAVIGRRLESNEEIDDAPASAHVKRTAQELYDPPAFVVRRSMPWANAVEQGLEFIAYGNSLDHFERQLRRMVGLDDGIPDALFTFSRPVTGGYYWCPPISAGRLDLGALGL